MFDTERDGFHAAFARPTNGSGGGTPAPTLTSRESLGDMGPIKVRMAVNTGEVGAAGRHHFGLVW